jgi:hypothetical protein
MVRGDDREEDGEEESEGHGVEAPQPQPYRNLTDPFRCSQRPPSVVAVGQKA